MDRRAVPNFQLSTFNFQPSTCNLQPATCNLRGTAMKMIRSVIVLAVISFLAANGIARASGGRVSPASTPEKPPAPREILGFNPGDDRKLADWSQIVGYFKRLASASGRISLQEPGLTTERRPFIYALISSEENIRNLTAIREAQRKLADPRLISSREEKDRLIRETPAV